VRFYCEHSASSAHVNDIANDQSGFTGDAAFGARWGGETERFPASLGVI
jgi:hypothetical protein